MPLSYHYNGDVQTEPPRRQCSDPCRLPRACSACGRAETTRPAKATAARGGVGVRRCAALLINNVDGDARATRAPGFPPASRPRSKNSPDNPTSTTETPIAWLALNPLQAPRKRQVALSMRSRGRPRGLRRLQPCRCRLLFRPARRSAVATPAGALIPPRRRGTELPGDSSLQAARFYPPGLTPSIWLPLTDLRAPNTAVTCCG